MKKYYIFAQIALLSTTASTYGTKIGFFPFDSSIHGSGLFDNNTNVDVYLMSGGPGPMAPFSLLPTNINIGTYQFNDSLTVPAFEFSLGALEPLLTNGVDEYLSLVLLGGSSTVTINRLESVWFGTSTDLIGLNIPNPTFEINELRSNLYGNPPFETLQIDYLDLGVTIVPEPTSYGLLVGSIALCAALAQRRKS